MGAGFLFGASFWIRQTVLVFLPCLAVSTLVHVAALRGFKGVRGVLPKIVSALVLGTLGAFTYFQWAQHTGNLKQEFSKPLSHMTSFDVNHHILGYAAMVFYLTFFLFPFLLLLPVKNLIKQNFKSFLWVALLLIALVVTGMYQFQEMASTSSGTAAWFHPRFPFLGNVILDTGVGPLTLADTFLQIEPQNFQRPNWGSIPWWIFTYLLAIVIPLWAGVIVRSAKLILDRKASLAAEIGLFGILVPMVMTFVMVRPMEWRSLTAIILEVLSRLCWL